MPRYFEFLVKEFVIYFDRRNSDMYFQGVGDSSHKEAHLPNMLWALLIGSSVDDIFLNGGFICY